MEPNTTTNEVNTDKDFAEMNKGQLIDEGKAIGLELTMSMNKDDMIAAIIGQLNAPPVKDEAAEETPPGTESEDATDESEDNSEENKSDDEEKKAEETETEETGKPTEDAPESAAGPPAADTIPAPVTDPAPPEPKPEAQADEDVDPYADRVASLCKVMKCSRCAQAGCFKDLTGHGKSRNLKCGCGATQTVTF